MKATYEKCRLWLDFYDKATKTLTRYESVLFEYLAIVYLIILKGAICSPFARERFLGRAQRF